jgi:hypothetical protein
MKISDGTSRSEKEVAKLIWKEVLIKGSLDFEDIEGLVIGKKISEKQRDKLDKFMDYYKEKFDKMLATKE